MGEWSRYRRALEGESLPLACVDLDAFDANVERLLAPARARGKGVRIATKSLRCPALIQRAAGRPGVTGLMCYSAAEARLLVEQGASDVVLAYPTVQPSDVAHLAAANERARCAVVVDDAEQLEPLARAARAGSRLPVVLDVDVSFRVRGLHLGVRRSPLREPRDVVALARRVADSPGLALVGVMAYEAQLAGVTDRGPFAAWQNPARRAMKRRSGRDVRRRRAEIVRALEGAGFALELVNGGGTGSAAWSAADDTLTEITVGSGAFAGHLFDYYEGLSLEPALHFALQVVRRPAPDMVTCHMGGYVASGAAGADRLPLPVLPPGCRLLAGEGAGEVQTPLALPEGLDVPLGAPVLFRPAKSGELSERFRELVLVRGDVVVGRAPTYRGLGHSFG